MRIHKDGYIQAKSMTVGLPVDVYRRAISVHPYRNKGIETEVEQYLGIEIEGVVRFRSIGRDEDLVFVEIDFDWKQPTRG